MKNLTAILKAEPINHQSIIHKITKLPLIGLFAVLTLFFCDFNSSAQEVRELGKTLASMQTSTDIAMVNQANHIENLVYELNPFVIIREGIISTYAEVPFVCVDIDAKSIDKLKVANSLFKDAELLTIRIENTNDLKIILDIASLNGFSNLKYINFLCSIDCTLDQVNKLVKTCDTKISVFYIISIPS